MDADDILCFVLGCDRVGLIRDGDSAVSEAVVKTVIKLAKKRAAGTPVPLLTGKTIFYGREFSVESGVLLPRPETELLVEQVLHWINKHPGPALILELGFGTGVIGISIAEEARNAVVHGWDVNRKAVRIAEANRKRIGTKTVTWHGGDFFKAQSTWKKWIQEFSTTVIVSNPPYIPSQVVDGLDKSVLKHDPRSALDGGIDGGDIHRRVMTLVKEFDIPAFLEIGYDQSELIRHESKRLNLSSEIQNDYQGHPRTALIIKTPFNK